MRREHDFEHPRYVIDWADGEQSEICPDEDLEQRLESFGRYEACADNDREGARARFIETILQLHRVAEVIPSVVRNPVSTAAHFFRFYFNFSTLSCPLTFFQRDRTAARTLRLRSRAAHCGIGAPDEKRSLPFECEAWSPTQACVPSIIVPKHHMMAAGLV
jgi:hypothetical protein